MRIDFNCPNCNQRLGAEESCIGQIINCPLCGKSITIPATTDSNAHLALKEKKSQDTSNHTSIDDIADREQTVTCPKCGKMTIPNALFCSSCGEPLNRYSKFNISYTEHFQKPENKRQPSIAEKLKETSTHTINDCGTQESPTIHEKQYANDSVDTIINNNKIKTASNELFANALGVEKLEIFSLSSFFSQVCKHHSWEDIEEILIAGTLKSTPPLSEIPDKYPSPWFFSRVLLFVICAFSIVYWRVEDLGIYATSILLMLGIIGIPLATLSFFWEINVPKNISIMQLGKLVCVGGFFSILATLFINKFLPSYSPMLAGPIEEIVKGCVMLLFVQNIRYKYKINGLLFGAAIGAGYAIIETGGYVIKSSSLQPQLGIWVMLIRAFFAPVGHVLYSSLVGYAIWGARQNDVFSFAALIKGQAIRPIILAILLHMFWNSPYLPNEILIKALLIAFTGYGAIIFLLQACMKEIYIIKQKANI